MVIKNIEARYLEMLLLLKLKYEDHCFKSKQNVKQIKQIYVIAPILEIIR